MPLAPVRNLAERGLLLDQPAFGLGLNAFSNGSNVRFSDGAVRRASVLRTARTYDLDGRRAVGFSQSSGYDRIFVGLVDGRVHEINEDETTTDRSPPGLVPTTDSRPWTAEALGDVLYMNHPASVPSYIVGAAATFLELPGWDTANRARAIAGSRDQLFAVNLTKGVSAYPNTVAISDYALYGQPPATWDPLASGVANEITLAGARTPLVGCRDLDGTMIVYAERQAWRFVFTGDTSNSAQNLWINEPLSLDRGLIGPNAAVYFERRHYVMGVDDLYVHDGVSVEPITNGKIRRWLYRNLDVAASDRCFAAADQTTAEIYFAFPSKDADARFAAVLGCNRAAVFNTRNGTWSLADLPDCTGADHANFNPSLIWSAATSSWQGVGGSWADLTDGFGRNVVFVVTAGPLKVAEPRLMEDDTERLLEDGETRLMEIEDPPILQRLAALDEPAYGRAPFPADTDVNPTAFVERLGIDMDELGEPLGAYKIVSSIFPQITVLATQTTVRFRLGTALQPQGAYTWGEWRTFDPTTDYRVDFNRGGRYLGIRMESDDPVDFEFAGLDVDIRPGGRR